MAGAETPEEPEVSTNYYAFGPFPGGEADGEGLHIGQTAAGWRFLFRGHPSFKLTTAFAWRAFLLQDATNIRDEYGVEYTPDEMIEIATQRLNDNEDQPLKARYSTRTGDRLRDGEHIDPDGHAFYNGEFC